MSRDKGNRAAGWVADYLRPWWPGAEAVPNGLGGADIKGTPPVAIEVKTGAVWRDTWLAQAARYGNLPLLVYLPPGIGRAQIRIAQAVMPGALMLRVATHSGLGFRMVDRGDIAWRREEWPRHAAAYDELTGGAELITIPAYRGKSFLPMHMMMHVLEQAEYAPRRVTA